MSYSLFTGSPIILHVGHCQYFIIFSCLAENFGVSATFKSFFFSFICFFVGICIFHVCWKCVSFPYPHPRGFFFFHSWLSVAAITMLRGKLAPHSLSMVLRKFLPIFCLCYKSIHLFLLWFLLLLSCFESPFLKLCKRSLQPPWQRSPWPLPFPHYSLPAECRRGICLKVLFPSCFSSLFLHPPNPKASFSSRLNSSVTSGSGPPERYDLQRSCVTPGLRRYSGKVPKSNRDGKERSKLITRYLTMSSDSLWTYRFLQGPSG